MSAWGAVVEERLQEVARVRRLGVEGAPTVPVELIDAGGVRTFVRQAIYEETTPEELPDDE